MIEIEVNPSLQVAWFSSVPFCDWPQDITQPSWMGPLSDVTDTYWHHFGSATEGLVHQVTMDYFPGYQIGHKALQIVGSGHEKRHYSVIQRIYIPLATNKYSAILSANYRAIPELNKAYITKPWENYKFSNHGPEPFVSIVWDVVK